jgi:membrane-associated phospholipid phosphatase
LDDTNDCGHNFPYVTFAMRVCTWPRWITLLSLVASVEVRGADFVKARIDGFTDTGNVMAYVLPAAALGLTVCYKDGEGAWDFSESAAITMSITVALKYAIHTRRPNGEPHSFPSGHSAITFSSAEFMRKRYGWKFGAPAYIFASVVGYSRVRAHVHYFRDVAAGAVIGVATTCIVSKPYHGWYIQPELEGAYRGLRVSRDF